MTRFYLVLTLMLVAATASTGASAKERSEYWTASKLKIHSLKKIVNETTCFEDEAAFLGCINAVESLLSRSKSSLRLVVAKDLLSRPKLGKRVAKFGALAVIATKKAGALSKDRKLEQERRWLQYFAKSLDSKRPAEEVPFDKLVEYGQKFVVARGKALEAEFYAEAINAFLEAAFDPHTKILPTEYFRELQKSGSRSVIGIGVFLRRIDGRFYVQKTLSGSPAEKAGLQTGDQIELIDGQVADGLSHQAVDEKLAGLEGATISFGVVRDGMKFGLVIARAEIPSADTVESKLIFDRGRVIGYIHLRSFFDENSCTKVRKALLSLTAGGANALVLDLRGNGGGLLDQGLCVANLFLDRGLSVTAVRYFDKADGPDRIHRTSYPSLTSLPLITLINSGSGSASEIVAAAFQDHERGLLLGERSYGKHTVQTVETFDTNVKVSLLRTQASFHRPALLDELQVGGVSPDLEVAARLQPGETRVLREEERYPRAIPTKARHLEGRSGPKMELLKACMASTPAALAEVRHEQGKDDLFPADYQLLKAQDAFFCMFENPSKSLIP